MCKRAPFVCVGEDAVGANPRADALVQPADPSMGHFCGCTIAPHAGGVQGVAASAALRGSRVSQS